MHNSETSNLLYYKISVSRRPVSTFLPGLFEARCRFKTYLIRERGKRWEIKNKTERVERKLKYMLSDAIHVD